MTSLADSLVKGLMIHGCSSVQGEAQVAASISLCVPDCQLLSNLPYPKSHRDGAADRHTCRIDFYPHTQPTANEWSYT